MVSLVEAGRLIFLRTKSWWWHHAFDLSAVSQSTIEKLKNEIG